MNSVREQGEPPDSAPPPVRIAPLEDDELDAAAHAMARSFLTEPNHGYFYPDDTTRERLLRHEFVAGIRDAQKYGHVTVAKREGAIIGAAVWLAPAAYPLSLTRKLRAIPTMARILRADPTAVRRITRLTDGLAKLHPDQPYWYLMAVGVDPDHRGVGIGSRLLHPMLRRADDDRQRIWLETASPENVEWYRSLGFVTMHEQLSVADDAPPQWTMVSRPAETRSVTP